VNVQASTEDKSDDTGYSFCKELGHIFDQVLKYHMKILFGDFNAKLMKEETFSNQQLGMRVYTKLMMILGLE
jgi:hypothetical protein